VALACQNGIKGNVSVPVTHLPRTGQEYYWATLINTFAGSAGSVPRLVAAGRESLASSEAGHYRARMPAMAP